MRKRLFIVALVLGLATSAVQATQIDLKALGIDADFEGYTAIGDGVATTGWASILASAGGLIANAVPQDDEFYTNPSRFSLGWQSNGTAGLNGKYGLQHPKKTTQNSMAAPFNGDFIGFVNLDDGDGLSQTIQSAVVGNLVEGTYTLTVAVAARPSASWNDVAYEISLVANPVLAAPGNAGPALGSRDGTVLGTPAKAILVSSTAVLGSNSQDLVYTLKVDANSLIDPNDPNDPNAPKLGDPFAIRIDVFNALQQNGVPDDGTNGGTVAAGTNYRFTQGNFDNVRLAVARPIDLKVSGINADFDNWLTVGNDPSKWASELTNTDLNADGVNDLHDSILTDDEYYTNPSSFGSGWQSNGTAGLNGKYGLQHPKKTTQNSMAAPFNGDFIGFVNLDDGDGLSQSIQSAVVGNLVEGTYTLTVAVAARPSASWNDVAYEISLVANPVLAAPGNAGPALGSRDGTVLGTPAKATLVSSTAVLGSNSQDLVYTLTVDANDLKNLSDPNDPNSGVPCAIRIDVYNALQQNGVPDDGTNGGTVAAGTNYRFTQGNFDNVRLTIQTKSLPVPEAVIEEEQVIVEGGL